MHNKAHGNDGAKSLNLGACGLTCMTRHRYVGEQIWLGRVCRRFGSWSQTRFEEVNGDLREEDFGPESYLLLKMAWLMSGQNSRNTTVIPSREAFSNHR